MKAERGAISGIALLACVAALAVAQVTSLASADRYIEQSVASQGQSAAVSAIQATVTGIVLGRDPGSDVGLARRLTRQLAAYRRSIEGEHRASRNASRQQQAALAAEAAAAVRFEALAVRATSAANRTAALSALDELSVAVADIAARERGEALGAATTMTRLKWRMDVVGVALAAAAAGLAILAGSALTSTSRRLARLVGERTAELVSKSERLTEIDRSRRLFFAKLSHELRSPITVMRGEAEVALHLRDDEAAMRGALGHVVANADVLDRRLDELLGLARAEAGRLVLETSTVDLVALVRATAVVADAFAFSHDIAVDLDLPDGPLMVAADPRWLAQALLTVVDNGIKFSGEGRLVTIALTPAGNHARVTITDRGPGIAEQDLPYVFEPYYQSAAAAGSRGFGLGLALARWVVEQHHGTISAANAASGGCSVAIELPVAAHDLPLAARDRPLAASEAPLAA